MDTIWKRKIRSGVTFEARVRMNGMDVPPLWHMRGHDLLLFYSFGISRGWRISRARTKAA